MAPVPPPLGDDTEALPAQDVARAGGWATVGMVTDIYTQADEETTFEVVFAEGELREVAR